LIAAAGWVLVWLTVALGGRRRVVLVLFCAVAIAASLFGVIEWRRRDQPVAVVIADAAPVRTAPYGGASAAATVQAGGALLVGRGYGPWVEVHRTDGIHGWVLGGEIAGL
jgi:Flp pilus assembly protein protease CpaA